MLLAATSLSAQVRRATPKDNNATQQGTDITLRAKSFIESSQSMNVGSQWSRTIYRELDLFQGSNASLYFPEEPMEGQTNLFRIIFGLIAENKVKAYEYLDGREIYSDKYELNTKEVLDKFYVIYEEVQPKGRGVVTYKVDESDVPCNEVRSYFIKEKWSFDQTGSKLVSSIEAICPVLHRSGDFGADVTKYPMFWIKYDHIKPYLINHRIMSEGENNVLRYNYDDFFVMRQYKGEIYKTMNLQNKTLMQLYPDADSLKMAREKIENELVNFEASLWIKEEAPAPVAKKGDKKAAKAEEETEQVAAASSDDEEKAMRRTNPRSKEATSSSSSSRTKEPSYSAPVRSVRRTRYSLSLH